MEDVKNDTNIDGQDQGSLAKEYLSHWKRERADFENYKKQESKRIEEFVKFANEDLILEMMEILDSLEAARKSFPGKLEKEEDITWLDGFDSIVKQSQDLLKKYSVERIEVSGRDFDPERHEAVEVEPEGSTLQEIRAGYLLHGKVIRPARIKIVK